MHGCSEQCSSGVRSSDLAAGARPPSREPEHHEPGAPRQGWQHEAAVCVERRYRDDSLFSRMTVLEKAMVRSQAGPNAGVALSTCPCSPLSRIESPLFRVLLQRRLSLPLPLSNRICRCGLPNDQFGITAQHARGQGCWEGGDSHSRAQQHEFAEKPEDEWRPTCLCGTWTLELRMLRTTVVWRLWSMDSHCSVQWTRHLCQQSRATEFLAGGQPTEMAWSSRVRAGRRGPTRSLWQQVLGLVWWCWPWRWAEDGPGGQHVCQVAKVRSEPAVVQRRME